MADKEIDELQNATVLDGTELLHVVQGGNSRKTTSIAVAALAGDGGLGLGYIVEKPPRIVQTAYARGTGSAMVELAQAPVPGNTLLAVITGYTPIKTIPGFGVVDYAIPTTNQSYTILMRTVQEGDGQAYTSTGGDWNNVALYEVEGLTNVEILAAPLQVNAGVFMVDIPPFWFGNGPKIIGIEHDTGISVTFDPAPAVVEQFEFAGTSNHWGSTALIDEGFSGQVSGSAAGSLTNPFYVVVGLRGKMMGAGPQEPDHAFLSGQHWRLRSVSPDPVNEGFGFAEIDWINKEDVSLVGTGTASASSTDEGAAEDAFDADLETGWFSGDGNAAVGAWIAYDFGEVVTPRVLKIAPLDDKPWSIGRIIALDVSDDGERWTQAAIIDTRPGVAETLETYTIPRRTVTPLAAHTPNVKVVNHNAGLTLTEDEVGAYVRIKSAADQEVVVPDHDTLPAAIGTQTSIVRAGDGAVELVPAAGVTLNTPESLNLRAKLSVVTITKVGENEWDVTGDLEPGA